MGKRHRYHTAVEGWSPEAVPVMTVRLIGDRAALLLARSHSIPERSSELTTNMPPCERRPNNSPDGGSHLSATRQQRFK